MFALIVVRIACFWKGQSSPLRVYSWPVSIRRIRAYANAAREILFDPWTNLDRMAE